MNGWIQSRSYADCHKWINEHDDELVREVLKYFNSNLLRNFACTSQIYSESLVFLALRMIHRHPLSLSAKDREYTETALQWAQLPEFNACPEVLEVISLHPEYVSDTPFSTLLHRFLPTKHAEIYAGYNQVCEFLRRSVSPTTKRRWLTSRKSQIYDLDGISRRARAALSILYDLKPQHVARIFDMWTDPILLETISMVICR